MKECKYLMLAIVGLLSIVGCQKSEFEKLKDRAESGEVDAQFELASSYQKGIIVEKDSSMAAYWYQQAAEQGYDLAQYNLGLCYAKGSGTSQSYQQAAYWFEKAAEQGIVDAQFNMGIYYFNGMGVPADESKSMFWFQKAAEQGDAGAQCRVGLLYFQQNDLVNGTYWCRLAAKKGDEDAIKALAQLGLSL